MNLLRSIIAVLWVTTQLAFATIVVFLAPGMILVASAEDIDSRWVRQTIRKQYISCNEWTGHCERRWRYQVVRRYVPPATRVYAYERREDYRDIERYDDRDRGRGRCLSIYKALGEERYDREKAKDDAKKAWASMVRFRHGVIYMDMAFARDVVFTCSKSSTGERASEKAASVLSGGGGLQQCEVEAKPCRADRVLERDDR